MVKYEDLENARVYYRRKLSISLRVVSGKRQKEAPTQPPKCPNDAQVWRKMIGHAVESTVNNDVAILFLADHIVANYSARLNTEWNSYGVK